MVLIYSNKISPRLQYICSFIFTELLCTGFRITESETEYKQNAGTKINYSSTCFSESEFRIQNMPLLFENSIAQQNIVCFDTGDFKAFFKTTNSSYPFDVFAASFYLISRYEEYLPYQKDSYGRYAHENSIAFKANFLTQPLINSWVIHFGKMLKAYFPDFDLKQNHFSFMPTYDVDIAYSYLHKGWKRNMGGFLKQPSLQRLKVLAGFEKDPFDVYSWLNDMHRTNNLQPVYFFLFAKQNGIYDKNILPDNAAMIQLVKKHAAAYDLGIHPSWKSGEDEGLLLQEKKAMESVIQKQVVNSRQHYIKFDLPQGYARLIGAGITDDYSMGYGSINGFRASVASSFYWYNLQTEQQTSLRIHPFCFMDANSFYEQKLTAKAAYDELMQYYNSCKSVNGTLITIWHNNFLGTDKKFEGWKEMYLQFIALVRK